jgi:hypothetical protein
MRDTLAMELMSEPRRLKVPMRWEKPDCLVVALKRV